MRSAGALAPLLLSAVFLFSVLTPEPGDVKGYEGMAIPAFVESDASFAVCSSPAVTIECHVQHGYLCAVPQVVSTTIHSVSSALYRGPPLLLPLA